MRLLLLVLVGLAVGCRAAAPAAPAGTAEVVRCPTGDRGPTIVSVQPQRELPLADPGGRRWLSVVLRLDFAPAAAVKTGMDEVDQGFCPRLADRLPEVEAAVVDALSGWSAADLMTLEGKERAKAEIRRRAEAAAAGAGAVTAVYFSQFVIR